MFLDLRYQKLVCVGAAQYEVIVLQRSKVQLRLIDDCKKKGRNQMLITDLFRNMTI